MLQCVAKIMSVAFFEKDKAEYEKEEGNLENLLE